MRDVLDESLFREHPERLAQGVAGHVEALRQCRLGQPGARGDVAVDDALTEHVGERALLVHAFIVGAVSER